MYYRFVFFLFPALALAKRERGFFARHEMVEPVERPQVPATAINSVLQKDSTQEKKITEQGKK